jgi:hypothetical protein
MLTLRDGGAWAAGTKAEGVRTCISTTHLVVTGGMQV